MYQKYNHRLQYIKIRWKKQFEHNFLNYRIMKILLLLFILFIIIILLLPYKYKCTESFYDTVSDLDKCENEYKDLDKKKTEIDKTIQDNKDTKTARQAEEDAKKDSGWKTKIDTSEADLKIATQKQKDAEEKLSDTNEKKAECEGKLAGMDAAIKNARECCDNEKKNRDLEALEYNKVNANLSQAATINNSYKNNISTLEILVNTKKNELQTCADTRTNAQNELASLKAKMNKTP